MCPAYIVCTTLPHGKVPTVYHIETKSNYTAAVNTFLLEGAKLRTKRNPMTIYTMHLIRSAVIQRGLS